MAILQGQPVPSANPPRAPKKQIKSVAIGSPTSQVSITKQFGMARITFKKFIFSSFNCITRNTACNWKDCKSNIDEAISTAFSVLTSHALKQQRKPLFKKARITCCSYNLKY